MRTGFSCKQPEQEDFFCKFLCSNELVNSAKSQLAAVACARKLIRLYTQAANSIGNETEGATDWW